MAYNTACGNGFPLNIGGGSAEISELESAVQALETAVGDSDSGLVKDVSDLQTTVGDSDSGLVKDVSDLETVVEDNADFSTTEKKVGSWLGEDRYRRVFEIGAMPNATTKTTASGLTGVNVKRIYGYAISSTGCLPLPFSSSSNVTGSIMLYYDNGDIIITAGTDRSAYNGFVVVEYTKVSNNAKKKK